jgi:hypothetical protein
MIYQVHDEHGKHFAMSTQEAEANEKSGWRSVSEAEFYGKKLQPANACPKCPKCGKEFARGITMHIKHCKAQ